MMIALSVIWSLSLCKAIDAEYKQHYSKVMSEISPRLWDILAVFTTILFFAVLVSKTGL